LSRNKKYSYRYRWKCNFSKKNSTKEIIKDEDLKENKIKTYFIEVIPNSENIVSNNLKINLNSVIELIKPYMKKEDFISFISFNETLEDLMKEDLNYLEVFIRLEEKEKILDNTKNFEDIIFSKKFMV